MNSKQEQFNHRKKHKRHTIGGVVIPAWYMYAGYVGPENGYNGGELTEAREYNENASNALASEASSTSGDGSGLGGQ